MSGKLTIKQILSILILIFVAGCAAQNAELDTPPDKPAQNIEEKETPDETTSDDLTVPNTNFLAASGSMNTLEKIWLGGVEQWIQIQSNDITKPIILILHGLPGYVMMPLIHEYCRALEDQFIIVNWDQRGAGKSYSPDILENSMTLEQLLSDARELTVALKERFGRDKIYLLGHSAGTMLGILLINNHPEHYLGFIGVGQFVDFIETEKSRYNFALEEAVAQVNKDAIDQLLEVGHPNDEGAYKDESGYKTTNDWLGYFGGSVHLRNNDKAIIDVILKSDVYVDDHDAIEKGWEFSDLLYDDANLWYLDLKKEVTVVDVPTYFLLGRHDRTTSNDLVVQYYQELTAPLKEIIWFENSAHFPFYEESDVFSQVLINISISDNR